MFLKHDKLNVKSIFDWSKIWASFLMCESDQPKQREFGSPGLSPVHLLCCGCIELHCGIHILRIRAVQTRKYHLLR